MARTTGRSGFKLKSGNKTNFKGMGSSMPSVKRTGYDNQSDGRSKSSAFQKDDEQAYRDARSKVINSINADMSDEQLRAMVVKHNAIMRERGGMKHRIAFNHAKSLRNQAADYKK